MRWFLLLALSACAYTPSDDPKHYDVDSSKKWSVTASEPRFIVPNAVPTQIKPFAANNNVAITFFEGRLYVAFRSSGTHFASERTRMFIMSSDDEGKTFRHEHTINMGTDMREPLFVSFGGKLRFFFFQAGTSPVAFEPKAIWRTDYLSPGKFSEAIQVSGPEEVPWDVKARNGRVWMTSYRGNHYQGGEATIDVQLKVSDDGENFVPVDPEHPVVYHGGVSESSFELDEEGNLWAVTRNEDGDATGFGSHLCFAPRDALAQWECSPKSNPARYDSPRMFRHGSEIYLVARRDPTSVYDLADRSTPIAEQRLFNLVSYSGRTKRTALYHINRDSREVEHVFDLPGVGDTSFPSIHRLEAHRFLVANYTSPLDTDPTWIEAQTSERGTQIYLTTLSFSPQ